jgi:hypothetical protein
MISIQKSLLFSFSKLIGVETPRRSYGSLCSARLPIKFLPAAGFSADGQECVRTAPLD